MTQSRGREPTPEAGYGCLKESKKEKENKMNRLREKTTAILLVLFIAFSVVGFAPIFGTIDPAAVEVTLYQGESHTVTKYVTTPEYPPVLDLLLLEDETGSFWDDIELMQGPPYPGLAEQIWDGIKGEVDDFRGAVAGYRDFPTGVEGEIPWGSPGDWNYRLLAGFTNDKTTWITGINALTAGGGADGPEAQYAALICGAIGGSWTYEEVTYSGSPPSWREDATKVIVLVTDAPPHVNGDYGGWPGPSYDDTVTDLEGFHVLALSTYTPWYQDIADATDGSTKLISSDSSDIVNAVMAALEEIKTEVWGVVDSPAGITVTLSPDPHVGVTGGTTVEFQETITVDISTEPGTYTFTVDFYANTYPEAGTIIGEQTITVTVKPIPVDIDIKPGSDPNSINIGEKGLLPVAILGSNTFDVADIDPSTIELGGASLASRGSAKAPKMAYSLEDVDGDGHIDLIAFFSVTDLVEVGVLTDTTVELILTAELYSGPSIAGSDSVRVVPP